MIKKIYQKQVAKDILLTIEKVCFSDAFLQFRVNNGSNGQRDYIINYIKNKYNIE